LDVPNHGAGFKYCATSLDAPILKSTLSLSSRKTEISTLIQVFFRIKKD
jgi:hypothetical protein